MTAATAAMNRLEEVRSTLEEIEAYQAFCVEAVSESATGLTQRNRIERDHYLAFCIRTLSWLAARATMAKESHVTLLDAARAESEQTRVALSAVPPSERPLMSALAANDSLSTDLSTPFVPPTHVAEHVSTAVESPAFSGPEHAGQYLDVTAVFNLFTNAAPSVRALAEIEADAQEDDRPESVAHLPPDLNADLFSFVSVLDRLAAVYQFTPQRPCPPVLEALRDYLMDYTRRVYPLVADRILESPASLTRSVENAIQGMSADRMKDELRHRGLKAGGRPEERRVRLVACMQVEKEIEYLLSPARLEKAWRLTIARLERKLLRPLEEDDEDAGAAAVGGGGGGGGGVSRSGTAGGAGSLEIVDEELAKVAREAQDDADDKKDADAGEEEAVIYNPKNLPLGPDGKPIPVWLYKLHGLNMYFTCEICGNEMYRGPRAFEKHFQEWRHARSMKFLGIPNTRHFHHITKIADARAIYERIQQEAAAKKFDASREEEFEDSAGNVLDRRTYEDLYRQGLL